MILPYFPFLVKSFFHFLELPSCPGHRRFPIPAKKQAALQYEYRWQPVFFWGGGGIFFQMSVSRHKWWVMYTNIDNNRIKALHILVHANHCPLKNGALPAPLFSGRWWILTILQSSHHLKGFLYAVWLAVSNHILILPYPTTFVKYF